MTAVTGISLTNANTITGLNATITGSGNLSLINTGLVNIAGINIGNNDLTLNNTGIILQTGIITARNVDFNTVSNIILLTLNNAISGTVTFPNSGTNSVSLSNTATTLTIGTTNVGGGSFSISNAGAITTSGTITSNGGSISLTTVSPDTSERNLTINNAINSNGGNIILTAANNLPDTATPLILNAILNSGTGTGGTFTTSGGLSINTTPILGAGDITLNGGGLDLTLGALSVGFDAGFIASRNITLTDAITTSGGANITFTAGTSDGEGVTLQSSSSIIGTGDVTFNGNAYLSNDVSTSDGDIVFNNAVVLNENITLTSTDTDTSAITLAGGVSGNNTLDINGNSTGTYNVTISGSIDTAGITVTGGENSTNNNLTVTSAAAETWNITALDAGTVSGDDISGSVSFSNVHNITGSTAGNDFVFAAAGQMSGVVDGNSATEINTLDLQAATSTPSYGFDSQNGGTATTSARVTGFANINNIINNEEHSEFAIVTLAPKVNTVDITDTLVGEINDPTIVTNVANYVATSSDNTVNFTAAAILDPETGEALVGGVKMTFTGFDNFTGDWTAPTEVSNVLESTDETSTETTTDGSDATENADSVAEEQDKLAKKELDETKVGNSKMCASFRAPSTGVPVFRPTAPITR